ncbi:MAG: hypothetical protein JNM99_10860 [Verrucomicrobiaceae bacterium]|nr:hypothetical protein [Verrucomicrobiaceae bacterium]
MDLSNPKPCRMPRTFLAFGSMLAITAALLVFWWFYAYLPWWRINNEEWMQSRSWSARAREQMTVWRRQRLHLYPAGWAYSSPWSAVGGGGHEIAIELAAWVGSRQYQWLPCCDDETLALQVITNHHFEQHSDWLRWLNDNRLKSRDQWVKEGFEALGFTINIPPWTTDNITKLLRILGRIKPLDLGQDRRHNQNGWLPEEDFAMPGFARINAYRWIRDTDINLVTYLQDAPAADAEVMRGVKAFLTYQHDMSSTEKLGRSDFARADVGPDWLLSRGPCGNRWWFPWVYWAATLTVAGIGFLIIRRARGTPKVKSTPASPTSHRRDTADDRPDH